MNPHAMLSLALACFLAAPSLAERIVVPLIEEIPEASEALWLRGAATGQFVDPGTGKTAQPATMARLAASEAFLRVGVVGAGDPGGEAFTVTLYPRAAFGRTAGAPGASGDEETDGEQPPWPPDRAIRYEVGADSAEGVVRGLTRQPGGFTMEIAIPIPSEVSAKPGDMWLLGLSRGQAVWSVAPDKAGTPENHANAELAGLGKLFFGRANLLDNGGLEEWKGGTPAGWTIEDKGGKPARAAREWNRVLEGRVACAVPYRGSVRVAHSRPVALRPRANYVLSLALLVEAGPGSTAEIILDLSPGKRRKFAAPDGLAYVSMPFVAEADTAQPEIVVMGESGNLVLDDIRLEMALSPAPPEEVEADH